MARLIAAAAAAIFCLLAPSSGQDEDETCKAGEACSGGVRYVFIGNPGVGKSATLNGIIGNALFRSGLSFGQGLTQTTQTQQFGPDLFMHSPGLADIKIQDAAADEIMSALKLGGDYKIVFVLTLESCLKQKCRVRPQDKATIELVLKAAPDVTDYGVIINKIEKKAMKILQDRTDPTYGQLLASLMHGLPENSVYVHLNPRSEVLADGEDVIMPDDMRKDILTFLAGVPPVNIDPLKVGKIQDFSKDDFQEKLKDTEAEMEQIGSSPSATDDTLQHMLQHEQQKEKKRKSIMSRIGGALKTVGGGIWSVLQTGNEVVPMVTQSIRGVMELASVVRCTTDPASCGGPPPM
jgi:hypothetical protein